MGLFDEEGSEDGLFGPVPAPAPPAGAAAGLFAADDDAGGGADGGGADGGGADGGGLFGADAGSDAGLFEKPAAAAAADEPAAAAAGGSTIVASLFAAEDSDAGSVDFEKLVGGGGDGGTHAAAGAAGDSSSASDGESDSGSESSASTAAERDTRYKVVASAGAIIRADFDMESEYVRTAEEGEMLEALSTMVNHKGVARVETAEGWVSQTTADGSTKLLHWMGAGEVVETSPEPEPEPETAHVDLTTAFWDYLTPTHKAIAELEARKASGDFWTCDWCGCELEDTDGTKPGPDGCDTLCMGCGDRYEDEWECGWCNCAHKDTPKVMPGPPEECKEGLCLDCGTRYQDEQYEAEKEKEEALAAEREVAAAGREEARKIAEIKRVEDAAARAEQMAHEKVRAEEAEGERVALDAQTSRRKRYRVVNQAVVRLGFNINSPTADVQGGRGSLHIGEVIEVLEERLNDNGVNRICCEDGWISERAANGTVLLEPGTEWWRVVAPAKIRTGWQLEAPSPPPIFPQTLTVGEVFEAREIRQDDPADEDDPDDEDMVEALHLRFAVGRWVSEIEPDGQFVLEKLAPEEQEQYESTARRAQEQADKAEAERVEAERIRTDAEARAKADAAAAAKEESIAKAKLEAVRIRQAEADGTEVGQWLRNLNLGMYTIRFKDQGYEEIYVLKHVLESRVDILMQEVEMTVGHSFRFREGLSMLQAEDVESAQDVLDAEREFLINDATVAEAADLQAALKREKQAEELTAMHMAARKQALEHASEAQERADLAELRAYQDVKGTDLLRKALSGDVAKQEALERRYEQETAIRKRAEADTAVATSRFKQSDLDLRTCETRLRATAEQATVFEKRRTEAMNKRKADEVGRVMAMNEVAELMPRVERAEELAEAATRVAATAVEAEAAAKESLDTARMRARMGPEALVASLEEGALEAQEMMEGDGMALVDAEEAASKREQMGAEEEVRVGQVRALLRAAAGGDEARIVQLLADGVDVNAADAEGDTALGLAAEHGHVECATLLLANGADFTQIPTAQWSYEQVGLWFNEAFEPWFEVKYSAHLQAAQIDGEALLALDEAALRDDLGVYLGSHRRVILKELASRAEQDEVTSARRLLVAEEEREQLRERLAKEGEARREREENLLDASRKHEIKTLELAWKATVAVAEERAEDAAREAADNELSRTVPTALMYTKGNHLRLSVRTPAGEFKRVDAWEGEPVSALKLALQKITGLAPTQQSLTFRFKELAPTLRLGSYNIPDNSVLELKRVAGGSGRSNILLQSLRK